MEGSNLPHSRLSVNGLQTAREDPRNPAAAPWTQSAWGALRVPPPTPPRLYCLTACVLALAPRGFPVLDGSGLGSGCLGPRVETSAGARGWGCLLPPSCRGWRPPGMCCLWWGGEPVSRCLSLAQPVLQALDSVSSSGLRPFCREGHMQPGPPGGRGEACARGMGLREP